MLRADRVGFFCELLEQRERSLQLVAGMRPDQTQGDVTFTDPACETGVGAPVSIAPDWWQRRICKGVDGSAKQRR